MLLSHYDPDPAIPARQKLDDALARHMTVFGGIATVCYTSPLDDDELIASEPIDLPVTVKANTWTARGLFYVGREGWLE